MGTDGQNTPLFTTQQRSFLMNTINREASNLCWGTERLKRYLRELKDRAGAAADDRESGIHTSWPKHRLVDNALDWIERFDPTLEVFAEHHRDFELSRAKAVGIYSMPAKVIAQAQRIIERFDNQKYDLATAWGGTTEGLSVVEVSRGKTDLNIVLAENSLATLKHVVPEGAIAGLRDQVKNYVFSAVPDSRDVAGIEVKVTISTRTVTLVNLDLLTGMLEISTDTFRVGNLGQESDAAYAKRFREALSTVLEGVDDVGTLAQEILAGAAIDKKIATAFRKIRGEHRLAVPATIALLLEADQHQQGERIHNEFLSQQRAELLKKVREFYAQKQCLTGFFEAHTLHDPDKSARIHRLLTDEGLSEDGCTCFLFFVRDRHRNDPAERLATGDRVIDCVRVTLDPRLGVVRGDSKEVTQEQLNAVLAEIRNIISQQQATQ